MRLAQISALVTTGVVGFAISLASSQSKSDGNISAASFRHHYIATDIPQRDPTQAWGYGTPVLADFDRDGDLDFAVSTHEGVLYWFENQGPDNWTRHEAAALTAPQLGAALMDVDGDGWPDVVVGGQWFRNPHDPRKKPFTPYTFDDSVKDEVHDVVAADMDGDGQDDVVVYGQQFGCYWYKVPRHPERGGKWQRTMITMADMKDGRSPIHGGIAPHGVADLNGDGAPDVVLTNHWYENRDHGKVWVEHPLFFGKSGPYGYSSRAWIADINKDGRPDIVITESDQQGSRIA